MRSAPASRKQASVPIFISDFPLIVSAKRGASLTTSVSSAIRLLAILTVEAGTPHLGTLSTMSWWAATSESECTNDLVLSQTGGEVHPFLHRFCDRVCDERGHDDRQRQNASPQHPRLPHRPSRMSVSVLRGESASGSSLSSITDGLLLASAAQNAGAKSAVASTV
jgi:hypothetical protein